MSKYDALADFLKAQHGSQVPMRFADIERVLGFALPPSARHMEGRAWWSNNPDNSVMTKVWLKAGFKSENVDIPGERVVFSRARAAEVTRVDDSVAARSGGEPLRQPLIFGRLRGTVTIIGDITEPTGEIWNAEQGLL